MPKLDDQSPTIDNDPQAHAAATEAVQQSAQDLAQQVRDDLQMFYPERGTVMDESGDMVQGMNRDPPRDAKGNSLLDEEGNSLEATDSVNEMGQERIDRDLERLDAATEQFAQTDQSQLTDSDRELLDKLATGLQEGQESPDTLDEVRQRLTDQINDVRESRQPWDPKASDEDVVRTIQQDSRLQALEQAKEVADAGRQLLEDTMRTSVSSVERQEIDYEKPGERPDLNKVMGASASAVAGGPEGSRSQWMHALARMFGGTDTSRDVLSGNAEVHKDMTALERTAQALGKDARVEMEITSAHKGIWHNDGAQLRDQNKIAAETKDRAGYEMRLQMWVSNRNAEVDKDAKALLDMRLNLQGDARDPTLKPVFDELRNLRDDLRAGRSPEETIQRLGEYVQQHQDKVSEDEDRMRRIWGEVGGEGDVPGKK